MTASTVASPPAGPAITCTPTGRPALPRSVAAAARSTGSKDHGRPRSSSGRTGVTGTAPADREVLAALGQDEVDEGPGGGRILRGPQRRDRLGDGGDGTVSGIVAATEHLGSDTLVHIDVPGTVRPLLVRLSGDATIRHGSSVTASFDSAFAYAFDSAGRRIDMTLSLAKAA